ncbi:MAG: SDR family oxidoreductase [Algoriphagus sp.]|uniref:SDR family NAD(P)-dependent oxidoreductase n=1 Tax=Algoriphagus sp. TaxID=1872435 RepID=UPI0017B297F3|nr:glucose 1-dehydrogenase [Algoriphagus sp.]NVJ87326.1 SDR family oxidoreductase [Algoriphagus sp.]
MKTLENKVAIITGAASGIGKAAAFLFSKEGAKVVVSDIDEKLGEEVVEELIKQGGDSFFFKADTSKPEDNEALVAATVKKYGKLDIAVNNAGIGGPLAETEDYPLEGWQKVIGVNLSGVFYGMHYQLPAMEKNGGGVIVNIASILGMVGTRMAPAYVAAKHGVVGLTKTTALEYGTKNIRVNSVGPGYILTPLLTKNLDEESIKAVESLHPIGRLGKAEEVAELILWLSSPKSSFVTGSYYAIDGGYLAQ